VAAHNAKSPAVQGFRCAEEDSTLHPVIPDHCPQPGNPGVISVHCVHIVQIVQPRGRYGRNGRSGCCHERRAPCRRTRSVRDTGRCLDVGSHSRLTLASAGRSDSGAVPVRLRVVGLAIHHELRLNGIEQCVCVCEREREGVQRAGGMLARGSWTRRKAVVSPEAPLALDADDERASQTTFGKRPVETAVAREQGQAAGTRSGRDRGAATALVWLGYEGRHVQ
jgi:hypothetical protein